MFRSRNCSPITIFSARYLTLLAIAILVVSMATPAMAKNGKSKRPPKIDKKTAKFEVQYMKKCIDRHTRIAPLFQNIETKTTNTLLIAFVNTMAPTEAAERQMMKSMLYDWYKITYNPKVKPPVEDDLDEEDEDTNDDIEIIGSLIGYANSEIAWSKQVEKKAGHPELKALAKQMIVSSRAQVSLLKSMLRVIEDDDEGEESAD